MSGRDFGRGGRGFGPRPGGFEDRDEGRGGPPRDRGNAGAPAPRPWEQRDNDRPAARPLGDRPFERAARPEGDVRPEQDRDVRVERYYDEPARPPREDRPVREDRPAREDRPTRDERPMRDDRPPRFGGDRDAGRGRDFGPPAGRPAAATPPQRPTPPAPVAAPAVAPAAPVAPAAVPSGPRLWTPQHLLDSWHDEEKLKSWTPTDQEIQDLVEDNVEGDTLVPGRDRRGMTVVVKDGVATLTGIVRSRTVKFAAGCDAYWTYGVREVRNDLVVRPRGQQAVADVAPTATAALEVTAPVAAAPRASRRKAVVEPEAAPMPTVEPTAAPPEGAEALPDPAVVGEPGE